MQNSFLCVAITPSVFVRPSARPRFVVASWLKNSTRKDWVEGIVAEELWATLKAQGDTSSMVQWAEEHTAYLTTDENSKITLDKDLEAIQMGYDDPRFLEVTIGKLASDDEEAYARAKRLLNRYVPEGPTDGSATKWRTWYDVNKPYLFATDFGHYRWYIDPLAKSRGMPSKDLRGINRRDVH